MKKSKNIMKILIISIIFVFAFVIKSFAAVQVEIVPSNTRITNVTVSQSFKTCRDMDSLSSTLGTTTLDPHLVTNKDWGAVSYLTNSVYGVNASYDTENTSQGKVGKNFSLTENGVTYNFLSTTGNISGVMNWGGIPSTTNYVYTQTAGLLKTVVDANEDELKSEAGETTYENIKVLLEKRNTKYVESVKDINDTKGMAIYEAKWGQYNDFYYKEKYPSLLRNGLFGLHNNKWNYANNPWSDGGIHTENTFRPVIWNIE